MPRPDRLSALMSRFAIRVTPCSAAQANFLILSETPGAPADQLLFCSAGDQRRLDGRDVLFAAHIDWGGQDNPLMAALPEACRYDLSTDQHAMSLCEVLLAEQYGARCGAASVMDRLVELLFLRLIRGQIEAGTVTPGLLGGLSDPRLSRAIVAMHEHPELHWSVDMLAQEAGLSQSRFAELFRKSVGQTPLAYLRNWRLVLARREIENGRRIGPVANRYGYGSPEALSRAISRHTGQSPRALRQESLARQSG